MEKQITDYPVKYALLPMTSSKDNIEVIGYLVSKVYIVEEQEIDGELIYNVIFPYSATPGRLTSEFYCVDGVISNPNLVKSTTRVFTSYEEAKVAALKENEAYPAIKNYQSILNYK